MSFYFSIAALEYLIGAFLNSAPALLGPGLIIIDNPGNFHGGYPEQGGPSMSSYLSSTDRLRPQGKFH